MIPVCFPQEISIGFDDGSSRRLLASAPPESASGSIDPQRVYLALEETLSGLSKVCIDSGLAQPVRLSAAILAAAARPLPLADLLARAVTRPPAKVAIGLINGGGGGLGDAIMFGPALDILLRRLRELGVADAELTLYSLLPHRTASILGRIPGVRVVPLPVTMAEFMAHDAYADFSGMLNDPKFATMHMTDFTLERLGIDPLSVPASDKEPFLNLEGQPPPLVQAALALARSEANSKPLVAVVFVSSYTRTMPEEKAAALITRLAQGGYHPVLLFPEGWPAPAFIERYGLPGLVSDLTAASPTFTHYIALLAGVDAIVSVDTSAIHIGAALRKPTVAIFNSIRQETRIRYSPTVYGIQLGYRGKRCEAPCGLSKARAFLEGRLPNGGPFRLECGYACDEAVDREGILRATIAALHDVHDLEQLPNRFDAIRQEMVARLHARLAPCWEALEPQTVLSALAQITTRSAAELAHHCPVCGEMALHLRVGRTWGVDRTRCLTCQASFPGVAPSPNAGQELPSPVPAADHARGLIRPLLGTRTKILAVTGQEESWPQAAWQEFLRQAVGDAGPILGDRRPGGQFQASLASGPFAAIILLSLIDAESRPRELLGLLASRLAAGGLLFLVAHNSQKPGQCVTADHTLSPSGRGPGWERQTMARLLRDHGLQEIWLGSTPLTWQAIEAVAGPLPTLDIKPPDRPEITVRLRGADLAGTVSQHLARVLQNITDHGQFWICCARKPETKE